MILIYLQNTVPASRTRTISYNAVYPISALGFKSPTLAQLMARYATMDPILFSATADKRKGAISNCTSSCQEEKNHQESPC
jgi:hypothetical protein